MLSKYQGRFPLYRMADYNQNFCRFHVKLIGVEQHMNRLESPRLKLNEYFLLYKIIEQRVKCNLSKTQNSEVFQKADRSIIFNQIKLSLFCGLKLHSFFFQSSGNTPSSSNDRNISFNGITIVLPHSLIILIDILSHQ